MGEKINKTSAGLAIKGYDPVASFEDGKPARGNPGYQFQWNRAMWRFSSAAHVEAFAKNPDRYAQQYGWFCAYGVSEGHTAPIDPEARSIIDGRLYLDYYKQIREKWRKDTNGSYLCTTGFPSVRLMKLRAVRRENTTTACAQLETANALYQYGAPRRGQ